MSPRRALAPACRSATSKPHPARNCGLQIADCRLEERPICNRVPSGRICNLQSEMEESVSENEETLDIVHPSGEPKEQMSDIPEELAILPLFNTVIYPLTVIPLAVGQEQSIRLIDEAMVDQRMVGLVT